MNSKPRLEPSREQIFYKSHPAMFREWPVTFLITVGVILAGVITAYRNSSLEKLTTRAYVVYLRDSTGEGQDTLMTSNPSAIYADYAGLVTISHSKTTIA